MGTNYYHRDKPCTKCGCSKNKVHIGKSSWGWQFSFMGHTEDGITSYQNWLTELENPNKEIVDEYDRITSKEDFIDLVLSKKNGLNHYNVVYGYPQTEKEKKYCAESKGYPMKNDGQCWKDNEGYTFFSRGFC